MVIKHEIIELHDVQKEVQQVLSEYYFKKVEEHTNEVWDKLGLTQEKLDELANIHERLPYR